MKFITFEQIKAQLRLDDEQAEMEHDMLCDYGESAEETVLNTLNRTLEDIVEQHGCIPMPIKRATLMLVDNAYKERSPVSPQNMLPVPYSLDMLLKPYMRLTSQ
jgi:hypothetical protein